VAEEAQRALDWLDETDNEADCLTDDGWARANQLADRESLSEETIDRMAAFFDRNERFSDAEKGGDEVCQWVSWKAWGGSPGQTWAEDRVEAFDRVREADQNAMDVEDDDATSETDTMTESETETDTKQEDGEGGDGSLSALDLMEQLDQFDSDDVDAVMRTAEISGQDPEEVASGIVGDMLPNMGGSEPTEEPDMNANKEDYDDEPEEDTMADTKTESEVPDDVVTAGELDEKLDSFRSDVVDSVTEAVTDDDTVKQIGQKLASDDEVRGDLADNLMDDVDEKLDQRGTTPMPTQPPEGDSGRAADALMGGGDE
jgi:hypothetical protein